MFSVSCPTPIAVFDAVRGRVEIATQSADRCFKLHPGVKVDHLNLPWLDEIYEKVLHTGQVSTCSENDGVIQYFIDNKEYFFQPTGDPDPDGRSAGKNFRNRRHHERCHDGA